MEAFDETGKMAHKIRAAPKNLFRDKGCIRWLLLSQEVWKGKHERSRNTNFVRIHGLGGELLEIGLVGRNDRCVSAKTYLEISGFHFK